MRTNFPLTAFNDIETPFYYYDVDLLRETLATALREAAKYEGFHIHYAVKANFNPQILSVVNEQGIGADCVSGGEVKAAIAAGIPADKVVFAGVGKTDKEIDKEIDQRTVGAYGSQRFFSCKPRGKMLCRICLRKTVLLLPLCEVFFHE